MAVVTRPSTSFTYDPSSRRYRAKGGRYITGAQVRQAVDSVIDTQTLRIQGVALQLQAGSITLGEWQLQTAALLKEVHVAMGLAACGGLNHTTQADLGYISSLMRAQYGYLRDMVKDISLGRQKLDGSLLSRIGLYGQASRCTFETIVRRKAAQGNVQEERRVLGLADHCDGCVEQARQGWQPLGTLKPIGSTQCLANCRCTFTFRA